MDEKTMERLAREAKNAYNREWSARNPEKRAAINKRYWAKRALQMMAQRKEAEKDATENADD